MLRWLFGGIFKKELKSVVKDMEENPEMTQAIADSYKAVDNIVDIRERFAKEREELARQEREKDK
tara:strand:+ start:904 stop:1098 length:195 start_codon:yes stop_codon:yes gene_type:complete